MVLYIKKSRFKSRVNDQQATFQATSNRSSGIEPPQVCWGPSWCGDLAAKTQRVLFSVTLLIVPLVELECFYRSNLHPTAWKYFCISSSHNGKIC